MPVRIIRSSAPYERLKGRLERLLGMRFGLTSADIHTPIGKAFVDILMKHGMSDATGRDIEMHRLSFLAQDLEQIRSFRPALLAHYAKRIRKARHDPGHFFGIRFEVKMAALLVKQGIEFTTPDPPDFSIRTPHGEVHIECGSSRLYKRKDGDLWYKIAQELRDKSQKPYASRASVLAMDVTNLRFHGLGMQTPLAMMELKPRLADQVNESAFGGALLYSYLWDSIRRRYYATHIRADARDAGFALVSVLDVLAPLTTLRVNRPHVAREG